MENKAAAPDMLVDIRFTRKETSNSVLLYNRNTLKSSYRLISLCSLHNLKCIIYHCFHSALKVKNHKFL